MEDLPRFKRAYNQLESEDLFDIEGIDEIRISSFDEFISNFKTRKIFRVTSTEIYIYERKKHRYRNIYFPYSVQTINL